MVLPNKRYALLARELEELSHDVGLSPITLARFLDGKLELSERSGRRVEAAIADLGLGRAASTMAPRVILIVPELRSPYFAKMAQCVADQAGDLGWDVLLALSENDVRRELRILDSAQQGSLIGLLLFTNNGSDEGLLAALSRRHDVVGIAEQLSPGAVDTVSHDYQAAGRLAGQHLLDLGHKRIAFIGGNPDVRSTGQISAALTRELSRRGINADCQQLLGTHSEHHGYAAIHHLAKGRRLPTAVFAGSSAIAHGIVRACQEIGLSIPRDLSLLAFDGAGPIDLFGPSITCVAVGLDEVARRCLSLLGRPRRRYGLAISEKIDVVLKCGGSTSPPQRKRHAAQTA